MIFVSGDINNSFIFVTLVMETKKFIDVEKILKEKVYNVYKWLPRFIINWLKKKAS